MAESILIVDDQRDVVDTMCTVLRKHGFGCETAFNGEEGIKKAIENEDCLKIVFLDIMMPGMNGIDVARKLRERFSSKIKIVYVSIKPKAEVNLEDVDGYIQKPFKVKELLLEAEV